MSLTTPLVELRDVARRFGAVQALDGVSLQIGRGAIHCLAGENGSGKSTLIKILSGINAIDRGEIVFDGAPVTGLDPRRAIALGIQVIYQDFSLLGNLTVAENLAIGRELRERRTLVSWRRMRREAEAAVARLGLALDLDATVNTLPTSGRQLVAIARALSAEPRLLIMDEPTTTLTGREITTLFDVVRDIRDRGIAILFVSHKMREMLSISEDLTVLRSGRVVADGRIADFDEAAITRAMTGGDLVDTPYRWAPRSGDAAALLEVENLTVPGELDHVSLSVAPGEIVGVSGLLGAGRTELALALFGMRPGYAGTIRRDGHEIRLDSVAQALAAGIAYVPEDRLTEGLFLGETIDRNIVASSLGALATAFVVAPRRAEAAASRIRSEMKIATPSGRRAVSELSGGNQQRVLLGRWLLREPRLLVLNGPTVGVDVGSKAGIHALIRQVASERRMGVLMISDDLPELASNCNRILVLHRGRIAHEMRGPDGSLGDAHAAERDLGDRLRALT